MEIERFVSLSQGEWRSMRSGHSLAFQQFEEVLSTIQIKKLSLKDADVVKLIKSSPNIINKPLSPFRIDWKSESDWSDENSPNLSTGSCLLIPIPNSHQKGILLRSLGYTEPIRTISNYCFLSDGTFQLETKYQNTIAEERIWFISKTVRCRASVTKSAESLGILQTSFASEVKIIQA